MCAEPYKTQILDALTGSLAKDTLSCADTEGILKALYVTGDETVWKQIWEMFALIRWLETLKGDHNAFASIL
jgi:hypothetical protein